MKKYVLLAIVSYLVIMNVAGFVLMLVDKKKSKKRHARRIPETVLLCIAYLGGSIGVMAGMEIFRHKTKHKRFYLGIPLTLIGQVLIIAAFYFVIR